MAMLQGLQNNLARYFNFNPAEEYDVSDQTESMEDYIARVRAEGGTLSFSNLPGKGYDTHTIREQPIPRPAGMTPELVRKAVENTGVDPYQPFDYNTGTEQEFVDSQIRKREVAAGLQPELLLQRERDLFQAKNTRPTTLGEKTKASEFLYTQTEKEWENRRNMFTAGAISQGLSADMDGNLTGILDSQEKVDGVKKFAKGLGFEAKFRKDKKVWTFAGYYRAPKAVERKGPPPKSVSEVVNELVDKSGDANQASDESSAIRNELVDKSIEDIDYGHTGLYQDPLYRFGNKLPDYLKRLYKQFDVPIGSIGMQ